MGFVHLRALLVISLFVAAVPAGLASGAERPAMADPASPAAAEPERGADSESRSDCEASYADVQEKLAALRERFAQEWRAFEEQYEEAYAAAASAEEQRELQARYAHKEAGLRDAYAQASQRLNDAYPADCRRSTTDGPIMGDAPQRASWCNEPGLHDALAGRFAARIAELEEHHVAIWEAFERAEHGEEAEEARGTLAARLAAEARTLREALRAEETRFLRDLEEGCSPVAEPTAAAESLLSMRMECEVRGELPRAASTGEPTMDVVPWQPEPCGQAVRAEWEARLAARATVEPAERIGSWLLDDRDGMLHAQGRYVEFMAHPASSVMTDFMLAGTELLLYVGPMDPERGLRLARTAEENVMHASGAGLKVWIHDAPSGLIRFEAQSGAGFFAAPARGAAVEAVPGGFRLALDGVEAYLRAPPGSVSWDGTAHRFGIWGEAVLVVPQHGANPILGEVANAHRAEIQAAVDARLVGGEVTIVGDAAGSYRTDRLVYDDVTIDAEVFPLAKRLEVTFASETLGEARVFVVNVDRALLHFEGRYTVEYESIDPETGAIRGAPVERAASLDALLSDSSPEIALYVIVEGDDGLQVVVRVPHWSIHRFSLAADGFELAVPVPAGFAALALAAAAWAAMRRRR